MHAFIMTGKKSHSDMEVRPDTRTHSPKAPHEKPEVNRKVDREGIGGEGNAIACKHRKESWSCICERAG